MLHYALVRGFIPNQIDGVVVGQNVARLRAARGWSAEDLGRRADLATQYIYRLEKGRHPKASRKTLHKLATALEVDTAELTEQQGVAMSAQHTIEIQLWEMANRAATGQEARRLYEIWVNVMQSSREDQERLRDYASLLRLRNPIPPPLLEEGDTTRASDPGSADSA